MSFFFFFNLIAVAAKEFAFWWNIKMAIGRKRVTGVTALVERNANSKWEMMMRGDR